MNIQRKHKVVQAQQFSKVVKKTKKHMSVAELEQIRSRITLLIEEQSISPFNCRTAKSLAFVLVALS
jgi:hypothetical protein